MSNSWTRFGLSSGVHEPGDVGTLFALDAANSGATLWSVRLDAPSIGGGITLANGVVFSTTVRGSVLAHDAASGAPLWNTNLGRDQATPVSVVNGWLYTGAGMAFLGSPIQRDGGGVAAFSLP